MLKEVEKKSWFVVVPGGKETELQLVTQFGVNIKTDQYRIFKTWGQGKVGWEREREREREMNIKSVLLTLNFIRDTCFCKVD